MKPSDIARQIRQDPKIKALKLFKESVDRLNLHANMLPLNLVDIQQQFDLVRDSYLELIDTWNEPPASVTDPQPPPRSNDRPPIADLVISDMEQRKQIGIQKYGTPLQAFNGRSALTDLYQELLDAVVYVRQVIEESAEENAQ